MADAAMCGRAARCWQVCRGIAPLLVRLAELGVGERDRLLLLQPTPRLRLRTTDLAHLRPGHTTTHAPLTCRAPGKASAAPRGGLDTNRHLTPPFTALR